MDDTGITLESPWLRERLAQVERRFRNFLTSEGGRLYALFGGARAGKTTLLRGIQTYWTQRKGKTLPVYIDLAPSHALSTPQRFFELLFDEMCEQHDICYPEPRRIAGFFQTREAALPDFKEAFGKIVGSPDSKIQGARFVFLLDNADEICPFIAMLCEDFKTLFQEPDYIDKVTRQMDIVMAGGLRFYERICEADFPDSLYRYPIEVLPVEAARAFVETLPGVVAYPDVVNEILRYTGRHPYILRYLVQALEARVTVGSPWSVDDVTALVDDWIELGLWEDELLEQWFIQCARALETGLCFSLYASLAAPKPLTQREMLDIARGQMQDAGAGLVARMRQALDILTFYGLIEQPQRGMYQITSELFRRWFVTTYKDTSGRPPDIYTPLEVGMANVLARMTNRHPRYAEACIYQQRLAENIAEARLYGDTDTTKAERFKILHQINALASEVLGKLLAELQ